MAAPKNAFTDLEKVINALTSTLMLAGFVWLAVNLFSPLLMNWLVPPEWIKLSSIFWWISFIGGLLGVLAKKSTFETD